MGDRVDAETRVEALDHERSLPGRLAAAVRADRDAEPLGGPPDDVEGGIVQVLVADVGRRHQSHEALALLDAALQLLGGELRVDHRELRDELQAVRAVARVLGARIVHDATDGRGELRVAEGPLLTGAGREHDGDVDPLEVHIGDARDRIVHAPGIGTSKSRSSSGRSPTGFFSLICMPPPGRPLCLICATYWRICGELVGDPAPPASGHRRVRRRR
jgi:hypothetical protein